MDDWDGVLRCLQTVRGDFDVEILRVRNRFTATADVPQVQNLKSQPTTNLFYVRQTYNLPRIAEHFVQNQVYSYVWSTSAL